MGSWLRTWLLRGVGTVLFVAVALGGEEVFDRYL